VTRPLGASLGAGLLFGTLGSLLIVLPAAIRTSVSFGVAWLVLGGSTALALAPAAALLRCARPLPRGAWVPALGLLLAFPPLVVFARVLELGTHHRPLGGATFAIVAAGVIAGAIAVAARALSWETPLLKKLVPAATAVLGVLALELALPVLGPALRAQALDGGLAVALVGGVAFSKLPEPKLGSWLRPLLWVLASLAGMLLGSSELRGLLVERAPVLAGVTAWLR